MAAQTDLDLPRAIALVTLNPAAACGLSDRGRIAVGLRADLVAVAQVGAQPLISHTWSAGRLVFSTHYPPVREHEGRAGEPQSLAA
ncbi:Alpha-D-ribose 1-methylphosphonate 5-triphosphate diphosphatase [compost metagenome]